MSDKISLQNANLGDKVKIDGYEAGIVIRKRAGYITVGWGDRPPTQGTWWEVEDSSGHKYQMQFTDQFWCQVVQWALSPTKAIKDCQLGDVVEWDIAGQTIRGTLFAKPNKDWEYDCYVAPSDRTPACWDRMGQQDSCHEYLPSHAQFSFGCAIRKDELVRVVEPFNNAVAVQAEPAKEEPKVEQQQSTGTLVEAKTLKLNDKVAIFLDVSGFPSRVPSDRKAYGEVIAISNRNTNDIDTVLVGFKNVSGETWSPRPRAIRSTMHTYSANEKLFTHYWDVSQTSTVELIEAAKPEPTKPVEVGNTITANALNDLRAEIQGEMKALRAEMDALAKSHQAKISFLEKGQEHAFSELVKLEKGLEQTLKAPAPPERSNAPSSSKNRQPPPQVGDTIAFPMREDIPPGTVVGIITRVGDSPIGYPFVILGWKDRKPTWGTGEREQYSLYSHEKIDCLPDIHKYTSYRIISLVNTYKTISVAPEGTQTLTAHYGDTLAKKLPGKPTEPKPVPEPLVEVPVVEAHTEEQTKPKEQTSLTPFAMVAGAFAGACITNLMRDKTLPSVRVEAEPDIINEALTETMEMANGN